jgi:hypothetical protein
MNKIIPFNKDITFNNQIGEITSIALDDTLKFVDGHNIKGELIVRGCHKYLDNEQEFSYPLPVEIAVDDKYNTEKATIMVDDFYYEIINENILRIKIDLILDDISYQEVKIEKEIREVNEEENNILEIKPEIIDNNEKVDILDLFKESNDGKKEYSIYRVYTIADGDTLDSILAKYKINKEELEEINDLTNLKTGVKVIIPCINE